MLVLSNKQRAALEAAADHPFGRVYLERESMAKLALRGYVSGDGTITDKGREAIEMASAKGKVRPNDRR